MWQRLLGPAGLRVGVAGQGVTGREGGGLVASKGGSFLFICGARAQEHFAGQLIASNLLPRGLSSSCRAYRPCRSTKRTSTPLSLAIMGARAGRDSDSQSRLGGPARRARGDPSAGCTVQIPPLDVRVPGVIRRMASRLG